MAGEKKKLFRFFFENETINVYMKSARSAQVTGLSNPALSELLETKPQKSACVCVCVLNGRLQWFVYTVSVQMQQIQLVIRFQASSNLIKTSPSVSPKQH